MTNLLNNGGEDFLSSDFIIPAPEVWVWKFGRIYKNEIPAFCLHVENKIHHVLSARPTKKKILRTKQRRLGFDFNVANSGACMMTAIPLEELMEDYSDQIILNTPEEKTDEEELKMILQNVLGHVAYIMRDIFVIENACPAQSLFNAYIKRSGGQVSPMEFTIDNAGIPHARRTLECCVGIEGEREFALRANVEEGKIEAVDILLLRKENPDLRESIILNAWPIASISHQDFPAEQLAEHSQKLKAAHAAWTESVQGTSPQTLVRAFPSEILIQQAGFPTSIQEPPSLTAPK
jgi:hypothetical protein